MQLCRQNQLCICAFVVIELFRGFFGPDINTLMSVASQFPSLNEPICLNALDSSMDFGVLLLTTGTHSGSEEIASSLFNQSRRINLFYLSPLLAKFGESRLRIIPMKMCFSSLLYLDLQTHMRP